MQDNSPIAVVGYSYRAPGVGRKGLWDFLAESKSAWSKVPADRFDQDAYYHPNHDKAGCFSSQGGHFLPDDVYTFDAAFFNLRAEEARNVDPQHRMLLECALEAAECAGLTLLDLAGANIGVFSAFGNPEYGQQLTDDLPSTSMWTATGNAPCMFANRLSYFFDLAGPSIALDAACASSTYAMHMACQSLRSGECNAAFVSAASLLLGPNQWVLLDNMGALSPEGRCFSYDKKASGFGRGEGGACILIKCLEDAINDGDPIQAVIRNSACNHSGRSEGITMPGRSAQEKLLLRIHKEVGLSPLETAVVEGHGTGTQAGDPIEAGAFATVLGSERSSSDPLYIGSLKSNFGHLEGASGLVAMIKAILMIQKGVILPNAGFEEFNENIEGRDRLKVATTLTPWPRDAPKRVCVTNFGFGGSNAAVILEEALLHFGQSQEVTHRAKHNDSRSHTEGKVLLNEKGSEGHELRLFVLSAKSELSLTTYLSSFQKYLAPIPESNSFLKDLSFTLGQRRTHHPYRLAVVADSISNIKAQLSASKVTKTKHRIIAYAFTGQGAQHAQMASGLQRYEVFALAIDQANTYLRKMGATWSLKELLSDPDHESRIHEPEISQPACTAIQLALVTLLRSWGLEPTMVTGHSSGEIAAAFAANLISFRAAMAIAYFRGQSTAQIGLKSGKRGAMLALGTDVAEALMLIERVSGYVTVAAINSPRSVTVSGDESAIEDMRQLAEEQGLFARRLNVKVAYHSRHMELIAASYRALIEPYCNEDRQPSIQEDANPLFISSVTGGIVQADTVDSSYWVKNLLQPVKFVDAIESIFSTQNQSNEVPNVIIEVGPHSALKNPVKQIIDESLQSGDQRRSKPIYLPSLVRGISGDEALLYLAGKLFSIGSPINLAAINQLNRHDSHVLSDLPPYAWNKSVRYLCNSWIKQGKLHPGQPYDTLLGWKIPCAGGNEHIFRQVFTLDDMPWIRDHNILGQAVFPMTGYLSMAIEALRRLSPTPPPSILFREIHIKRSLEISEDERVDITTKLRPATIASGSVSSTAWTFEISSWSDSRGWMTHCFGQAEPDTEETSMETQAMNDSRSLASSKMLTECNPQQEYATWAKEGIFYGPAFQTMDKFWKSSSYTMQECELRSLDLSLPSLYGSPVSVDPPTLDSFLHGMGPLQEINGKRPAQMPNYISRLRISNQIPTGDKQRFTAIARQMSYDTKAGTLQVSCAVFAHGADSLIPVADWECITLRTVSSLDPRDPKLSLPSTYRWHLLPSLDFVNDEVAAQMFVSGPADEDELRAWHQLNLAAIFYMRSALKETKVDDSSKFSSHLLKFVNWMRKTVVREDYNLDGEPLAFLDDVRNSAQGEMLCAIGENLVSILRGEIQPLEIMLKDNLLAKSYESNVANVRNSQALAKYVRQLSDVKSTLRVIEIGGGTGSATLPVLEELSHGSGDMRAILNYTFTDISPGFFENARTKFTKWSEVITFKKLDISQDPVQQGFAAGDYDLVIASNVLHATPNLAETLDHVQVLLKPGGKLVLLEATSYQPAMLPFILLPGWWLATDNYRSHEEGPLLSESTWDHLLSDTGFSGVDGAIADYPNSSEQMVQLMWSTKVSKENSILTKDPITVCGPLIDAKEQAFAQRVANLVTDRLGCPSSIKPFSEINAVEDPFCIIIDSPHHSILRNTSADSFDSLKNILSEARGVLWIVPEEHPPEALLIKGMLRTLRLEDTSNYLVLLEGAPSTSEAAVSIAKIAERLHDKHLASNSDQEYVWHEGLICVPRLRELPTAKETFAFEDGTPTRKMQNIWQDDASLELTVETAGNPDSIYFRRTDAFAQDLIDDEILVRVEAAGLNFRDVLLILGSIPWATPGSEGVGIVIRTGPHVKDIRPGDRVLFVGDGSFATFIRIPSLRACKIPDNISATDAASIPVAYSTAFMALIRVGRLTKGESVLIHAASGATGQACIVLAQYLEAQIFVTAGSPTKRQFLHETFGIPKTNIFSSRNANFRDGILSVTEGKGVDVIVNSLYGSLLQETWSLIADFGQFIEIGKRDLLQNSYLAMRPFIRNVTFSGLDLSAYFGERPQELRKILLEVVDLMRRKIAVPIRPVTTLPISEIAVGLRKLQSGKNIGKIIITMGREDSVLAECSNPLGTLSHELLRPNATYLITGGTGGVGLSLATRMIENGACNVVLLGRSGSSRSEVKKLLERYDGTDIHVRAIACDVGSREQFLNALQSIKDLPQIRGVVHGALYLRDSLFKNASYDDWNNIMRPRVQGAWNIHELLPNIDFFIALSSVVGIFGNIGQSFYAGTNTFFDSFAEYRNTCGLPTVSISIPVLLDVGYAAERNMVESLKSSVGTVLTEAHLWTVVKGAIFGSCSGLHIDGKAITFTSASEERQAAIPLQFYHPITLQQLHNSEQRSLGGIEQSKSRDSRPTNLRNINGDPVLVLLDALLSKVSSITMVEREEVEPDAPLSTYGLDSLVSVELRNWIRRETGVELSLSSIGRAETLRALTMQILLQQESK